jgi:hypothetical protein
MVGIARAWLGAALFDRKFGQWHIVAFADL